MSRILLFNMPWSAPAHAPLGVGIVEATLAADGFSVDTVHASLEFFVQLSRRIGTGEALRFYAHPEVGEVLSGYLLRGQPPDIAPAYLREDPALASFLAEHKISAETCSEVLTLLDEYGQARLSGLDLDGASACGFSLNIRQTMASLWWAREIKRRRPDLPLVVGGSHCEDPMGLELLGAIPWIDAVARGESDTSIAGLFRALIDRDPQALRRLPNLGFRDADGVHATEREMIKMCDTLDPVYDSYRTAYAEVEALTGIPANYYIEGSRGCWWGQKHQCTFCGIHGTAIAFREKTADQAYASILKLIESCRSFRFVFADTILSTRHIRDLLPRLEALNEHYSTEFLLDVKSNMTKEDVYRLARAGCVALQPGIESFSDRLLKLMDKGNTALQQIQFLKWCQETRMLPCYSILTHVREETAQDYRSMLAYLAKIKHLTPPGAVIPIELNRYAPYFENAEPLGFPRPVPAAYYGLMFDGMEIDLNNFAYHFEGVHPSTQGAELDAARGELVEFWRNQWVKDHEKERLSYRVGPSFLRIDRSGSINDYLVLEGAEAEVYLACDRVRKFSDLEAAFAAEIHAERLRDLLTDLCDCGYMLKSQVKDQYLSLAVRMHRVRPVHRTRATCAHAPSPAPSVSVPVVELVRATSAVAPRTHRSVGDASNKHVLPPHAAESGLE